MKARTISNEGYVDFVGFLATSFYTYALFIISWRSLVSPTAVTKTQVLDYY